MGDTEADLGQLLGVVDELLALARSQGATSFAERLVLNKEAIRRGDRYALDHFVTDADPDTWVNIDGSVKSALRLVAAEARDQARVLNRRLYG